MNKKTQRVYKASHEMGLVLGRLFISLIFIYAGVSKIFNFHHTSELLKSVGIEGAEAFAVIALIMEIVGGLSILLGYYTRAGIYILMIFLLPATLIFHSFWQYQGAEMTKQLINFLKNLAIYGGLIFLLICGPGKWSLDALFKKN